MSRLRTALATLTVLGAVLSATVAKARSEQPGRGQVALTFDDLPGVTNLADQSYVDYINETLIRGLRGNRLPATGFVNAGKLHDLKRASQIRNLERWLNAGMDLGNHTFSHESPNDIGASAYIEDIAKGDPIVRALMKRRGKPLLWFRHPYLETGYPEAEKAQINAWLAAHGYRVAPVTIDADDWEFAEPYDDAIARHDEVRRQRIRREYLDYTERTVAWYQEASKAVFDRQIAFVMLLHDTRLNADCIDDLAKVLARRKLTGVTLAQAMADPAYKLGDPYVGKDGIDWLERWSQELKKDLPWSDWQDPPADIVNEYNAVNDDQR